MRRRAAEACFQYALGCLPAARCLSALCQQRPPAPHALPRREPSAKVFDAHGRVSAPAVLACHHSQVSLSFRKARLGACRAWGGQGACSNLGQVRTENKRCWPGFGVDSQSSTGEAHLFAEESLGEWAAGLGGRLVAAVHPWHEQWQRAPAACCRTWRCVDFPSLCTAGYCAVYTCLSFPIAFALGGSCVAGS